MLLVRRQLCLDIRGTAGAVLVALTYRKGPGMDARYGCQKCGRHYADTRAVPYGCYADVIVLDRGQDRRYSLADYRKPGPHTVQSTRTR